MRLLAMISLILFLGGCAPSDPQFCECLKKSEAFNNASVRVVSKISQTRSAFETAKKLKKEKEEACKDYVNMSGEEMLKRKAECE